MIRVKASLTRFAVWLVAGGLSLECFGAQQAIFIDTKTHAVLAPPASAGASVDFDFTGRTTAGLAGGGAPGGSNLQLQFNNSSAFGGIPSLTYNSGSTRVDLQAGSKFNLLDPSDTTKKVTLDLSGITTGTTHNIAFPNITGTLVLGATSATDLDIAQFNGITGKLITSTGNLQADGAGTLRARHSSSAAGVQSSTIEMYSIYGGGAATNNFGTTLDYYLESSTTDNRQAGRVGVAWSNAIDASRTSYMDFWLVNNADIWASNMRLHASGGASLNSTVDPGAGIFNANSGFRVGNAATAGNVLRGNGTSFVSSGLSFVDLSDTPNSYNLQGGKAIRVNAGENALEFFTAAGSGTVTQIDVDSPIVATPDPITAAGTLSLNVAVDHLFTTQQTINFDSSGSSTIQWPLRLRANDASGAGSVGLGAGLQFYSETISSIGQQQGAIGTAWLDATQVTRTAYMDFLLVNNGAAAASKMRLFPSGGLSVNSTTDPAAGFINAATGYKINNVNIIGSSVEAWDDDLDDLSIKWLRATATGPSQLDFAEDTDNGTNLIRLTVPSSITASTTFLFLPEVGVGDTVAVTNSAQQLSNKRVVPRVLVTNAPGATPTINTDNVDAVSLTGINAAITSLTTNLSGSPSNFEKLIIRFRDDGTARAITFGASFEGTTTVPIPTTTTANKTLTWGGIYDSVKAKWVSQAKTEE